MQSPIAQNRVLIAGVMAIVGVIVLGDVVAGGLADREPQRPAIQTIEDAVALGVVDAAVVDELRSGGEVVGYVTLNVDDVVRELERRLPDPGQRAELLEELRAAYAELKQRLTAELGEDSPIVADFDLLSTVALRFGSEAALVDAASLPMVAAIRPAVVGTDDLAESLDLIRAREVHAAGFRGDGTYVAVLDTGVDTRVDPQFFPAASVPLAHRAGDANGSALRRGHGTHVASTVLAVAPGTKVIDVDVFRWDADMPGPQWSTERLLDGIRYVVGLKEAWLNDNTQCCNIVAMNLSLGVSGDYNEIDCTDDFSLRSAYLAGIVPVLSAGNSALHKDTNRFRAGIGYPACSPFALSVGASTDGVFARVPADDPNFNRCNKSTAVDEPTSFSQTGVPIEMLAPGNCIVAAGGAKQGTSMAAPHVAGAAAVLVSARPTATTDDVWAALVGSGPTIRDVRTSPPIERHRLDVAASVARLLGGTTPPVDPGVGVVRNVSMASSGLSIGEPLAPGGARDLALISIRNAGSETESLRMAVAPAGDAGLLPPGAWIETTPQQFSLAPGESRVVRARIVLPPDAAPGRYEAWLGPQRAVAGVPTEDTLAASERLAFTVEEPANPVGGLLGWLGRIIGEGTPIRLAFGGLMLVGAYRVVRPRFDPPPRPA